MGKKLLIVIPLCFFILTACAVLPKDNASPSSDKTPKNTSKDTKLVYNDQLFGIMFQYPKTFTDKEYREIEIPFYEYSLSLPDERRVGELEKIIIRALPDTPLDGIGIVSRYYNGYKFDITGNDGGKVVMGSARDGFYAEFEFVFSDEALAWEDMELIVYPLMSDVLFRDGMPDDVDYEDEAL